MMLLVLFTQVFAFMFLLWKDQTLQRLILAQKKGSLFNAAMFVWEMQRPLGRKRSRC